MSSLAIKRDYPIVLPEKYIDIEQDEMMYVSGGVYIASRSATDYMMFFSKVECADIAAGCAGATVLAFVNAAVGAGFGYSSAMFWFGSNHNGLFIEVSLLGCKFGYQQGSLVSWGILW